MLLYGHCCLLSGKRWIPIRQCAATAVTKRIANMHKASSNEEGLILLYLTKNWGVYHQSSLCLAGMTRLLLLLILLSTAAQAQNSDILLLRKGNRTIRSFFKGSQIEFYTQEKTFVSAVVDSIKRDSLFLLYYDAQMVPTAFGGMVLDTLGVYTMNFSLKNIYSFPARQRGFPLVTNGTLFMVGGAAYLALNIVNTLREKDPIFGQDNLPRVLGGAGAVALGWLLQNSHSTENKIGRKYKLKYLPIGG